MEKQKLRQVILDQQELFKQKENLVDRDLKIENYLKGNETIIITGIRRCGKSTLLKIFSKKIKEKIIYINFDDIRFVNFQVENFEDIEDIAAELHGPKVTYLLDEIQNIKLWQRWVNNLFTKKIKVFVTGSNAHLLSSEISTHLTGRNKTINLFPFSFAEFLKLKNHSPEQKTTNQKRELKEKFSEYFKIGGFPNIIKNDDLDLSKQYFEDILNKDIISRFQIRKTKEYKDLALYLFSNVGCTYSYSTLKKITGIKSLSMIKNYIDHLKNAFLAYTINKFDYSIKKQKISSLKFYVADNSFLKTVAFNFSENKGKRLENLVFTELLRKENEIYYYNLKNECDFLIKEKTKITQSIQVCYNLDDKNKEREIQGLLEAMKKFKLKQGLILTFEQEDKIQIKDKTINILPVWKWLLEN